MKHRFLLSSLFLISCTGLLQADSNPSISRVYADPFTAQIPDTQASAAIGSLDATFSSTNASVSLNVQLTGSKAQAVQVLSDGTFLVALSKSGSNSVVAKYNSEGTLTTYGTSGLADLGTSTAAAQTMIVDAQGRLIVAGGSNTGTAGWLKRVSADGTTVQSFAIGSSWQNIAGLAQQSTGNLIAVGFNGTNAQIARYSIGTASAAGAIDTTFATSGLLVLDGTGSLPTVTTGLVSVYIDANNNVYVAFIASATAGSFTSGHAYIARFTATGALDTTWNSSTGFAALTSLNSATSGLYLAANVSGNLIVGAQVSSNVVVTGVTSAGATIGSWSDFNTSVINADIFSITGLMTTSNGKIFVTGSDVTSKNMAVIRLTSLGVLDAAFHSSGYNIFNAVTADTTSLIQSATIAPNGQLYTVGYQVNAGVTIPYVSRLFNDAYVSQVAQFPATLELGNLDLSFGQSAKNTFAGVTIPFNGSYGSKLMQQAQSVIEITTGSSPSVGHILVGMHGKTNTSSNSNMMLSWLSQDGTLDATVGNSGYLTLANVTSSNEYLTSLLQGAGGVVYVSGYASATAGGASTGATLRAYSSWTSGTAAWSINENTAGYKGIAVGSQAFPTTSPRIIFFVDNGDGTGHISGYTSSGSLDTTFGTSSSGIISSTSYSMHMGPCYGGVVTPGDNIVVAYKNSSTTNVDVVEFNPTGTALESEFGTSGIVSNLFSAASINSNNIRTCFSRTSPIDNIIVAAVTTTGHLLVACLNPETGALIPDFNSGSILDVTIAGCTSLQLKEITGASDGTLVATFYDVAADNTMYVARILATGSGLDTTFNSQGSQSGLLSIKIGDEKVDYNSRIITSALVQSTPGVNQGNIVMVGYQSLTASDTTPMVMRSYGTPTSTQVPFYPVVDTTIPGTFDSAESLVSVLGASAGTAIFTYPSGNTYQGYMLVGYNNGTTSGIARFNVSDQSLDTTFGSSGIYAITGANTSGINSITIDANNKILVGGTTAGGLVWAQQLSSSATSSIAFTMPTNLTAIHGIYQQKSGRYIIAASGTNTGSTAVGILVGFQDKLVGSATTLVVDPTFNPLGTLGSTAPFNLVASGQCSVGATAGLYSIAINADDTILTAIANTASPKKIVITDITANGSGYVTTFNSGAALTTSISVDSSSVAQIAIDSTGKVVVAGSYNNGGTHQVQVQRFSSAGAADTTWNGTGITSNGPLTISNLGATSVTLSALLQTTTQQTVLVGYNATGGNGPLFAARLAVNGALDATWNPSGTQAGTGPVSSDTPGVLTYATNSMTSISGAAITINGTLASIGSTTAGTAGNPIATFVYGDTYVPAIAQQPLESVAGVLDLTIPSGSTGAWSMTTLNAAAPQKLYIYNNTVNSSSNGAMLIGSSNGTNSYISQLNADLSVNSSNFGTSGVVTIAKANLCDMFVANGTHDVDQPIYVTGDTGSAMWGAKISSNGDTTTLLGANNLTKGYAIRQQASNSRILVAGLVATPSASAVIAAFKASDLTLDTSFNDGTGYYLTTIANPILDMAVDALDRIYIAYQTSATAINIDRLLPNGTARDTTFGTAGTVTFVGTAFTGTSQIRMALDMTNNMLVVAAQDGTALTNALRVARFSTAFATDGTATGTSNAVAINSKVLNLSDLFIDTQATNPDIYVIGNNVTDNKSVVARLTTTPTTIALDTASYAALGSSGIANVTAGSMTVVNAGALDADRRVYLVGTSGTATTRYMARLFGDVYTTELSEATAQALHGAIDLTLDNTVATPDGGIVLSGLSNWSGLSGYTARGVVANADGTSFIAFGDGTHLIVGKVNADMVPMTAFGTNGLTTALAMATVATISTDAAGNICVAGTDASAQKAVIFSSTGTLIATLATPNMTVGTTIAQQKSGRYIVAGKTSQTISSVTTPGTIAAYQNISAVGTVSAGILPVDPTFGPAALTSFYSIGVAAQVDDICIDSQDYIYFVYRRASDSVVCVGKLTADGSGLVSSTNSPVAFNSGAVVVTGITALQPARIAMNNNGYIVVGATTSGGVKTAIYNASTGAINGSVSILSSTSTDVLTKLVGSDTGFYGTYYTATPSVVSFRITSSNSFDATGTAITGYGTSGVATFVSSSGPETAIQMLSLAVQPDGKVTMVGKNSSAPVLMRLSGYQFVGQQAQAPNQAATGTLDTTLCPSSGALELDTYLPLSTTITTLTGSSISRMYEYADGRALLVFSGTSSGANTVIARVLKDLTLDTTANGGTGFNTTGFITIAGETNANALFVEGSGNIFVAGGSTTSWVRAYDSTGAALTGWATPVTNLANGAYQIAEQSCKRMILAGQGTTNGTLYAYTKAGIIDTSFGVNGVVDMGAALAVTDIAIDKLDKIVAVSNNSGTVKLQRVTSSGGIVSTLSGGTAITTATGNPKVIFDANILNANIIVACATTAGFTLARYYNNDTTNNAGMNNGSQVTIAAGASSTSVLGNIYATSDGKVVLVGYETTGHTVIVARLTSNFVLDTTFGTNGVLTTAIGSVQFKALDGFICADNRVMIAGGSSVTADPYLARIFGDTYVTYVTQAPALGIVGTIDPTFVANTSRYDLSTISATLDGYTGQAILPLVNGGNYMTLNNGTTSQLIRTVAEGTLDTTFGSGGSGFAATALDGVTSMMMDGTNRLVLTGTTSAGHGWIQRYVSGNSGAVDTTFGTSGVINLGASTQATAAIEQTLARLVVAGRNGSGAILHAYTSLNPSSPSATGVVDTTFNSLLTPGYYQVPTTHGLYNLIADQYDRLIFAVLHSTGNTVDLYRLTPSGELDATFGTNGVVSSVIAHADNEQLIKVALDHAGNIVVAAHTNNSGADAISVVCYDNGTSTTITSGVGANGVIFTHQFDISGLSTGSLTNLVTSSDNCVLLLINQSGTNSTLIARLVSTTGLVNGTYELDVTFNPSGSIPGLLPYSAATGSSSLYNALAIAHDGRLLILGHDEDGSSVITPAIQRLYNTAYTTEQNQSPDSKVIGTSDLTLGASPLTTTEQGISFFATAGAAANYGQKARAIALQDDNNIVVALDGGISNGGSSEIFLNVFNNNGILNPNFNSTGQATVLSTSTYANQYVNDMITFKTADGINKAILAGYVYNATLGGYDSLLVQYNLSTPGLDSGFGGYDGTVDGVAFGDGQRINTVGRQSSGRIVTAGSSQDSLGLLLGYTSTGKLDKSFGANGYLAVPSATALYTHTIDTQNRVVVAYRNSSNNVVVARYLADGSGLDTSFGTSGIVTTAISVGSSGDSYIRVAIDGSNNILLAATNGTTTLTINSFSASNGTAGTPFAPSVSLTDFVLSRLIVDIDGKAIVVGYDTSGSDQVVIVRTNAALSALDTTFNPNGSIPGCLKYAVASGSTQSVADAMVHPDGRILVVGSQA